MSGIRSVGAVGTYGISNHYWYGFRRAASAAETVEPVTPVKSATSLPNSGVDAASAVKSSFSAAGQSMVGAARPESPEEMLLRYDSDPVGMSVRQRIQYGSNERTSQTQLSNAVIGDAANSPGAVETVNTAQAAEAVGATGAAYAADAAEIANATQASHGGESENAAIGIGEGEKSKSAAEVMEEGECETCAKRKYQDGSDDPGVSFKTAAHIAPETAAATVRGHEMEHVTREQAAAQREDRKVVQQSVTLHTDICPECGRVYVSGGTTRTVTAASNREQQAQQEEEQNPRTPFAAVA